MKFNLVITTDNRHDYSNVLEQLETQNSNEFKTRINMHLQVVYLKEKSIILGFSKGIRFYNDFFVIYNDFSGNHYLIEYKSIINCRIITDDNKTFKDTLTGAVVAGGLGAIASNFRKNSKYFIQIEFRNGHSETFKCKNIANAEELFISFSNKIKGIRRIEDNNSYGNSNIDENDLEIKLLKIKTLFDKGVLSKEEYEIKRKQIIEKY